MIDNWNGNDGYKFEVMEGPGGGNRRGCLGAFVAISLIPIGIAAYSWFV